MGGVGALLLVATVAGAVYVLGLPGEFVYDDHRLILKNEGLRRPFDVRRVFLRDYYAADTDRMGLGYYRPLAIVSNEIDFRRAGGRPLAFHGTNLLLHSACSALVFLLARRLLGGSIAGALAAGLLFALHPAHAESVAFISGRVDPLATLFVLLAVLAHLRANRSARDRPWRVAAGAAWLGALLSKEMALSAPVLVFLLESAEEGLPSRAEAARRSIRYLPYAFALFVYLVLRYLALGALLVPPTGEVHAPLWRPLVVVGSYLAWLVLPPPGVHLEPAPVGGVLAALAACAAAGAAIGTVVLWLRGARLASSLLAWCVVTLLPVAQFRPIETELSERFLYLPSVGACLLGGLALARRSQDRARRAVAAVLVALAAVYAFVLLPRVVEWRDEVRLWRAKLGEDPRSVKALLNLGRALASRGDAENARTAYESAVKAAPDLEATIHAEMESLAGTGSGSDPGDAIRRALESSPGDGSLWSNLGFVLLQRGDATGARDAFTRSVSAVPLRSVAWLGLALADLALGDVEGSTRTAERAISLNPSLGMARVVLAECALRKGRPCEALRLARDVALEDPDQERMRQGILERAAGDCGGGS